jgi:hypothetical protein
MGAAVKRSDRGRGNKSTQCQRFYADLSDGREVCFFVNKKTGLLVVDIVDADEKGGIEMLRAIAPQVKP